MLLEAFYLGLMVAIITFGVSNASEKGALLSPLYEWIIKSDLLKKQNVAEQLKELHQQFNNLFVKRDKDIAPQNVAEQEQFYKGKIDALNRSLDFIGFFKKPLISCAKCMPTVWTLPIYAVSDSQANTTGVILAIFIASIINTILTKHYPINR